MSAAGRSKSSSRKPALGSASKSGANDPIRRLSVSPRPDLCILHRHTLDARSLQTAKPKSDILSFSDAIAAGRRETWGNQISFMSRPRRDIIEILAPSHSTWKKRSPTPHELANVKFGRSIDLAYSSPLAANIYGLWRLRLMRNGGLPFLPVPFQDPDNCGI